MVIYNYWRFEHVSRYSKPAPEQGPSPYTAALPVWCGPVRGFPVF